MKTIICEKLPRIIKSKKKLEKELQVKITNRGKEVFVRGNPENEYITEKVIDALNFGFSFQTAMLIKQEDFILEIINIKEHTKRKDLERIRARIIGKKGKTLQTLYQLTKSHFEMKDNFVGIVGHPEYLEKAQEAIIAIIKGSKQSNIYNFLEKNQARPISDLGLKE